MTFDLSDRPNRVPWPPLLFAGAIGAALLLGRFVPIPLPDAPALRALGAAVVAAGLTLDLAAMAVMARARTNILPHRAADRLVTAGPFAATRNPIYVGNTVLTAGLALALAEGWLLVAAAAAAVAVDRLAVRREEAHLAARFGPAWRAYAARVPRWLGLPKR